MLIKERVLLWRGLNRSSYHISAVYLLHRHSSRCGCFRDLSIIIRPGNQYMTCTYCGSRYSHEETRCQRCGRKPGDTLSGVYSAPVSSGNLAPQLQPVARQVTAEPPTRPADLARAVQVPLFRERATSNVIPIETYAPPRPRPAAPKVAKPPARRASRVSAYQEKLDLLPLAPA